MLIKKLKVGKIYKIEWDDTFSFNGWYDDEGLKSKTKDMNYLQKSVGIFAGEYQGYIIIATHENPNKDFNGWGHPDWIPRGCIKKIKELKDD